jgi:hypothetical protein
LAKYFLGSLDVDRDSLQISRLSIMYVEYARGYYRKDGVQTSDVHAIQMALKPLVKMFGREKIHAFGPRKLKMVREESDDTQSSQTEAENSATESPRRTIPTNQLHSCDLQSLQAGEGY